MASSSKDDRVYDVFLSFGGEDTRRTFTDHLYCTLEDHQFNVFMYGDEYDYKLEKGNGAIPEHLFQEIERSKVAVVVFSRGYPESMWCLEELVKIMECRRTLGQMFFPIFYDVDPSDVLNQSGSFAQAFQKHELKIKEEKVHLWRNALKEAGLLAGLNFRETDGSSVVVVGLGNCYLTDDSIPKVLASLFSLEKLELDGNLFYSLPSLSGFSKLKMLDLSYCQDLLEIPDLPRSLEILRANQCISLAKLPNFSEMSSMVELHLNHSPKLTEILGLHKSLNTMRRIHMEGCTNLTAAFRKNILQGWTSCGHGGIFLHGVYDIPEWFQFVGIHESNGVHFKVPQIIGRNFRGLTLCCIFKRDCPGFTVTNITKGKALHIPGESTCWIADSVLRLQSVLSNDVLHLQSGDEVSISAVTEAHGRGRGRLMKTGVNLVWDDGDGGDVFSSNDEIGAVPSNTSSDETLPSLSVHTDRCPPIKNADT
ncbi:hypothetical protein DVH24_037678 [Malus domestica]|uniref:TIR domain-containing protein n=1 Tax=Malus domestica TaxID=3750 RepID=A0A498J2H6_MALDO|nr:hypothetical protein DVH24_037678 [Malus domestica]